MTAAAVYHVFREQTLTHWLQRSCHPSLSRSRRWLAMPAFGAIFDRRRGRILCDYGCPSKRIYSFLHVHQLLKNAGIHVPHCFHQNLDHGFLMLADFGDRLLLHQLRQDYTHTPYYAALEVLLQLQTIHDPRLPCFNHAHILQELSLFSEWFLQRYLQLSLTPAERQLLQDTQLYLAQALTQQPQVFIHRDYHSRNLMPLSDQRLGVIDFQNAMIGPIGYDIVSLLKDCYIQWPLEVPGLLAILPSTPPQVSHYPLTLFRVM